MKSRACGKYITDQMAAVKIYACERLRVDCDRGNFLQIEKKHFDFNLYITRQRVRGVKECKYGNGPHFSAAELPIKQSIMAEANPTKLQQNG